MNKKKLLIPLIIFLLILPSLNSIGLVGPRLEKIIYQPNYHQEITYFVQNYNYDVGIYTSGDFAKYVTLSPLTDLDQQKQFTATIQFPDYYEEPGIHHILIGARETGPSPGMISALTAIQNDILIEVYSPEKEIKISFQAPNANINEIMTFSLNIQSWSYQNISSIYALITLLDLQNNSLALLQTEKTSLKSGESKTLQASFNNSLLKPGDYQAQALVFYDQKNKTIPAYFKIGIQKIKLHNFTSQFTSHKINPFSLKIENIWNNPLKNVYAELFIAGKKVLKTPTLNLNPWEKATLKGFWEAALKPGKYPALIKLYYRDQVLEKEITISIQKPPIEEKPFPLTSTLLSIIIFLLIITFIILYFVEKK